MRSFLWEPSCIDTYWASAQCALCWQNRSGRVTVRSIRIQLLNFLTFSYKFYLFPEKRTLLQTLSSGAKKIRVKLYIFTVGDVENSTPLKFYHSASLDSLQNQYHRPPFLASTFTMIKHISLLHLFLGFSSVPYSERFSIKFRYEFHTSSIFAACLFQPGLLLNFTGLLIIINTKVPRYALSYISHSFQLPVGCNQEMLHS